MNELENAYMQGVVRGADNERRVLVESLRYDRSNQNDPAVVELYDATTTSKARATCNTNSSILINYLRSSLCGEFNSFNWLFV